MGQSDWGVYLQSCMSCLQSSLFPSSSWKNIQSLILTDLSPLMVPSARQDGCSSQSARADSEQAHCGRRLLHWPGVLVADMCIPQSSAEDDVTLIGRIQHHSNFVL